MDDVTRNNPGEPQGPGTTTTLPAAPVPPPPAGTPAGTAPTQTPAQTPGDPAAAPRAGWSTPPPAGHHAGPQATDPHATTQLPTDAGAAAGSPPPHLPPTEHGRAPEPKRRRAPLVLAGVLLGAVVGGAAGAGVVAYVNDDDGNGSSPVSRSDLSNSSNGSGQQASNATGVQAVAADVLPSVVSITAQSQFGQAGGTGVIISSDGEIVTNNHVVEGAGQGGSVQVTFQDGTTANAEVVGTDPLTDLAVIKAQDVSGLQAAELGNSGDLAVGQQVVAIGSPLGLDGTVTSGIVSALDRPMAASSEGQPQGGVNSVIDAIQTDAPINPGNSGGPLVNMDGQVVGINSAILTTGSGNGSIGLGFSIPIDQAKPIIDELRQGQQPTHAQIGVGVGDPQGGDVRGALIASVNAGSAGDDAGLQEGDIVTHVGDRVITDATSLIAAVRSHRPGDEIELTYVRDGQDHTTTVTLGSDAQTS
ncbi:S1C family serine protease [Jiangella mangrovi]|uniref:Putative serine protease PepD n=1 Tax=Jiangella mangrovi TaxID=1524084 RepID=A0A7W9GVQ4_9ACTN|nr:trypsin-like peptidase domain-containing protein [Jiangella mangrovi]MBB5790950.1 putative serine protease PepD [Jiangella mangrovi]